MKIISLALLISGILLTLYGLNGIGELGHDLLQVFSNVAGATQILPLAVGIVMVVVSIAGILPSAADAICSTDSASNNKSATTD